MVTAARWSTGRPIGHGCRVGRVREAGQRRTPAGPARTPAPPHDEPFAGAVRSSPCSTPASHHVGLPWLSRPRLVVGDQHRAPDPDRPEYTGVTTTRTRACSTPTPATARSSPGSSGRSAPTPTCSSVRGDGRRRHGRPRATCSTRCTLLAIRQKHADRQRSRRRPDRRRVAVAGLLPRVAAGRELRLRLLDPIDGSADWAWRRRGRPATTRPTDRCTRRPSRRGPAVRSPNPIARCVPVVSVGALNPNGTVAMFSNAGAVGRVPPARRGGRQHVPAHQRLGAAARRRVVPDEGCARDDRPGRLPWRFRDLERHVVRRRRSSPARSRSACARRHCDASTPRRRCVERGWAARDAPQRREMQP